MRRLLTLTLIATVAACSSDGATGPDRPITAIALTPAAPTILTGQTLQLTAAVTGGFAKPVIVWTTSNPNVATVTDSGVVAAKTTGTATISATASGITGTANVTVSGGTVALSPATSALIIGQTVVLTATVTSGASSPTVVWSSSNANVASVDASGKVTAKAVGSATISANAGGTSGTAAITVTAGAVDHVTVCNSADNTTCGSSVSLSAIGTSTTARAFAFNSINADISATCTFAWAPSANGVVSITFFGDATKHDALIVRTAFGVISIVVTCGTVPGVFTVNGPTSAPTTP